jgi:MFS family permease
MQQNCQEKYCQQKMAWTAVLVAALGYFVDVFDMYLFSLYRVDSLKAIGITGEESTLIGAKLLSYQLAGMACGGFFWGILADKRGRTSAMFGSIFIYSLATFLNAFVNNVEEYAVLRFVSGFGLAGEIGTGVTLVSELLPKERRGWGVTLVTGMGVSGSLGAAIVAKYLDWKSGYILGGVMGFLLLLMRVLVDESGMFDRLKHESEIVRGSLLFLIKQPERLFRYLCCVLIGLPVFVTVAVYLPFTPEIAVSLGLIEKISVADAVIYFSIGLTIGDLLSGTLSQLLKSRKKPIYFSMILAFVCFYCIDKNFVKEPQDYLFLVGLAAFFCGYWACLITISAEQFGTNIRATVATTVPNLVRGTGIISAMLFGWLKLGDVPAFQAAFLTACMLFPIAFIALLLLKETYGKDLDYYER